MNPFRARSLTALALVTATLIVPAGARAADDPAADQPQIHCSTDVPVFEGGVAGIRPQDDVVVDPDAVPTDEPTVEDPASDGAAPIGFAAEDALPVDDTTDPVTAPDAGADEAPVAVDAPPAEETSLVAEDPVVVEDPALTDAPATEEPVLDAEAVYCWAVDVPVYIDPPIYDMVPQRTNTPAPQERAAPPSSLHSGTDDTTTTQGPITQQVVTTTTVPETTTTVPETSTTVPETTTSLDVTTTLPGSTRGSTTAPGATPVTGRAHFTG